MSGFGANTFITVFDEISWDIHGSKPFTSIEGMRDIVAPMYDQGYSALLEDLVQRVIEDYPHVKEAGAEVNIEKPLLRVMGNEALLTQCVSNFLSNGAKFVSPGATPHIEIWAEERDLSTVRVWFKDNGLGIAPENHQRIFRMFERLHPASKYEGTGIGLTIVRKAAGRMGAQVGFESELGNGSRFWIDLKKDKK